MVNKKYIGSTTYVSDVSRLTDAYVIDAMISHDSDTPYIVIPDLEVGE